MFLFKKAIILPILLFSSCVSKYELYEKSFCEIAYSKKHHQSKYVFYKLYKEKQNSSIKRTDRFQVDSQIDSTIDIAAYKGTGFDRGHLKPAGVSKSSKEEMKESFLMSNISPQLAHFNRVVWKKYEGYERKLLNKSDSLQVYTGTILPKYFPKKLNNSEITIPKGFFKSILLPDSTSVNFIVYQTRDREEEYRSKFLSINELEKVIKVDLFPGLPDYLEIIELDSVSLEKLLR